MGWEDVQLFPWQVNSGRRLILYKTISVLCFLILQPISVLFFFALFFTLAYFVRCTRKPLKMQSFINLALNKSTNNNIRHVLRLFIVLFLNSLYSPLGSPLRLKLSSSSHLTLSPCEIPSSTFNYSLSYPVLPQRAHNKEDDI